MDLLKEILIRRQKFASKMELELSRPFQVTVIGDGGSGKSTLINTLFNTDLATGPAKPTTKIPQPVTAKNKDGKGELIFIDLPGVGESHSLDVQYTNMYLNYGLESDVILWSINNENRNVVYTINFINNLISKLDNYKDQLEFFNKFLFIITKVDYIKNGKWTFRKYNDGYRVIADPTLNFILEEKVGYFRYSLIKKFGHLIRTRIFTGQKSTNIDEDFLYLEDGEFICTKLIDGPTYNHLCTKYPRHKPKFDRIVKIQSPIPCSSYFKYNLTNLILAIIDKADKGIFGLDKLIDVDRISILSQEELDRAINIQIIN